MRFQRLRKRKGLLWILAGVLIAGFVFWLSLRFRNNVSFASEEQFNRSFRAALANTEKWIAANQETILKGNSIGLFKMMQECNQMHETPGSAYIVDSFLKKPSRPVCWKALLDPDWPVDADELNKTMKQGDIDNKWTLYAIAPEKSKFTPEELGLFKPDHWKRRQLTHQLWALIHLQERTPDKGGPDSLIEHLCRRIRDDLWDDSAVVDIYIQKVACVLRAGHPEMINRRWIERIIQNQNPDGGWDDRWMYFFRSSRRPAWRPSQGSNPHATIQVLWLMYQVKYRYPASFGLEILTDDKRDNGL